MDLGALGPYVGPIFGLLGGAFGTYCSVRKTQTPGERQLMLKSALALWMGLLLLIGLPFVLWRLGTLPAQSYWLSFILFFVLLVPGIVYINRRQAQLRRREHS